MTQSKEISYALYCSDDNSPRFIAKRSIEINTKTDELNAELIPFPKKKFQIPDLTKKRVLSLNGVEAVEEPKINAFRGLVRSQVGHVIKVAFKGPLMQKNRKTARADILEEEADGSEFEPRSLDYVLEQILIDQWDEAHEKGDKDKAELFLRAMLDALSDKDFFGEEGEEIDDSGKMAMLSLILE